MGFEETLSTVQTRSVLLLLIGILFIFFAYSDMEISKSFVFGAGLVLILIAISDFYMDTVRKVKIMRTSNSEAHTSKGEKKIAEYFVKKRISFESFPVIKVQKYFYGFTTPFSKVKLHPDFYLPEYNVIVEYWGMIDNENYKRDNYDYKKKLYQDNGIEFISLYPKDLGGRENLIDWIGILHRNYCRYLKRDRESIEVCGEKYIYIAF